MHAAVSEQRGHPDSRVRSTFFTFLGSAAVAMTPFPLRAYQVTRGYLAPPGLVLWGAAIPRAVPRSASLRAGRAGSEPAVHFPTVLDAVEKEGL